MADVQLTITDRGARRWELKAKSGDALMPVLRDQVDLTIGTCGGVISCGTCMIEVNPEFTARLAPPGEDEVEMLDALEARPGARLACQLVVTDALDGMHATIAPEL